MASAAFTPSLGPLSLLFNRQLENETDDHSPPLGAVMNEWRYTSTPPHSFMACTGIYTVEAAYYDHFGTCAFDNNNRLITLSGGYKNLHYLTPFIVTTFYMYKKQQHLFKNLT